MSTSQYIQSSKEKRTDEFNQVLSSSGHTVVVVVVVPVPRPPSPPQSNRSQACSLSSAPISFEVISFLGLVFAVGATNSVQCVCQIVHLTSAKLASSWRGALYAKVNVSTGGNKRTNLI